MDREATSARDRFRSATTDFQQVQAFSNLMTDEDLCWQDLIDALEIPGLVAGQAAIELHTRLAIKAKGETPTLDPVFWQDVLDDKGIDSAAQCDEGS